MLTPTPLNEFKDLLPENHGLTDEEIRVFRDLIDAQSDMIFDSFMAEKQKQQ